jgi:hypothetical protein
MTGFLSPQYLASKAERGEAATFENILQASQETQSGFENPINVFGLTNFNLGTGFRSFLEGDTKGQYPTRGYPTQQAQSLYEFPGLLGFAPSRPPGTEVLLNSFRVPESIIFQ